jgi:LuxR family transcriptional regulator, maltose regulon positive regulatory protein
MSIPLLATKLHIPRPRPELVARARLSEQLNAGLACQLTLVSTPAGFGKTTLLSSWAAHCGAGVAWLSLDEGDNDPVRFLAHLLAGLQMIDGRLGADALAALQIPSPPPLEELLIGLINQLSDFPAPCVLVLDDYHLIEAAAVHGLIVFLLDHQPAALHLVLASRADPPLPLARLRAAGQLVELRLKDLRFTPSETAEFLGRLVGPALSGEAAQLLTARTEGWIAGLQMAAVSLHAQDTAQIDRFIHSFTGSSHFVLDYLAEEVLQRQPAHLQAFLLRTSILERLSGPLCDALMRAGAPASAPPPFSQGILDQLEHANLFLIPLDDEQRWYRYHQLFADLLRSRLQQTQPELLSRLRREASVWHEHNGFPAEAITYALAAEDYERAVELIERVAETTLMQSEVATFLSWIEKLPNRLVQTRPALCVYAAWALLINGRPLETVERYLAIVDGGGAPLTGLAAPLRAFIASYQGQSALAAEISRQALDQLPEREAFLRSLAALTLGAAYISSGQMAAAGPALDEAARLSQKTGNVMISVTLLCYRAELHRREGQLRKSHAAYLQALERATSEHGQRWPVAGRALVGLGEIEREWNDLESAAKRYIEGIELTLRGGQLGALSSYLGLARVRQAQGRLDESFAAVQAARQLAKQSELSSINDIAIDLFQAMLWMTQGNLADAQQWAAQRGLDKDINPAELDQRDNYINYHLRKYEYPVAVRLWLAEDRAEEALALLDQALPRVEKWKRPALVIEMYALRALALQALGQAELAFGALEHALELAEPEGYLRLFVDEGKRMHSLLAAYSASPPRGRPALKAYTERLLAAFGTANHDISLAPGLVESLSDREQAVLRLLATSLSAAEIAEELCIAVSTVRSHTKTIYGKLGVSGRLQAVEQAKTLGLL